ncbi:phosphotransferase [Amycolatopsis alba]|uniref:phosphotransferase n=1 Tax=Amycolatopsis alba TaxID=76020 RepID=UPI000373D0FC|nr:phosphotransferase [Amycolatopsis alba]
MTTAAGEVRRITGPFVVRACLSDETGHHWTERLRHGTEGYLGTAGIEALHEALGDSPGCVLPVLASPEIALWPGIATPWLLSDKMLSGGLAEESPYWLESLRLLGSLAGRIHSVPLTAELRRALPCRDVPAWLTRPDVAENVRAAHSRLPRHLAPALAAAAAGTHPPSPPSLVHGRFSAGTCTAETPPRLLGWREAGIGDPLEDLAHLVADLVEAGSATGCPLDVLGTRVAAFLSGYPRPVDRTRLWSAVAKRIFDHYALGTWATGDSTGVAELLPAAEAGWLAIQESTP